MIFTKPLTQEQRRELEQRTKPSTEQLQAAQDALFMNLLERVAQLEDNHENLLSLRHNKAR